MTKEQMIDGIIRKYGFESRWTVWFCELAEILTENQLLNLYIVLIAWTDSARESIEDNFWPDNY